MMVVVLGFLKKKEKGISVRRGGIGFVFSRKGTGKKEREEMEWEGKGNGIWEMEYGSYRSRREGKRDWRVRGGTHTRIIHRDERECM